MNILWPLCRALALADSSSLALNKIWPFVTRTLVETLRLSPSGEEYTPIGLFFVQRFRRDYW
jgi:hypothetical protein